MAMLTLPQASGYDLLKTAANLKDIVDGLNALLPLRDKIDDAQEAACSIEAALNRGTIPERGDVERAYAIVKLFEDAVQQTQGALSGIVVAVDLLTGRLMRETDGDTVTPGEASTYAESECIYGN